MRLVFVNDKIKKLFINLLHYIDKQQAHSNVWVSFWFRSR